MPGPPPRRRTTGPAAPTAAPKAAKRRPTKGEKAQAREERRRAKRAHRAGVRAVRREQWNRLREWVWPHHTRRIGKARAAVVLILNIAPFPGLGTALYGRPERGLLQFALTFVFLIGWVWSIADGLRIMHRAAATPAPRRP